MTRAGQSLVPKSKAGTRAIFVPACRIVKGRVAAVSAGPKTIAAHAAHTEGSTCVERGTIAIAVTAAPTAVACAIVTGSGSGCAGSDRADRGCTSNGVIADISTDAVGAAHRAAMNASNRAGSERPADDSMGL